MAKASIHFKAVKPNSESHNERTARLDYNFPELEKNNESWTADRISNRREEIFKYCKKTSGRKMQKNAEPIKEAVVNLNSNHTMDDLHRLAQELKKQKGIDCFQIHIHRDEGKDRENLNYHAHMVFDWQDKATGKTLKLNRLDISQIQTIVAETLGMERGILKENSNRERLEAVEYKRMQEGLRVQELQKKVEEWEERFYSLSKANERAQIRNHALETKLSDLRALQDETVRKSHGMLQKLSESLQSIKKAKDVNQVKLQRIQRDEVLKIADAQIADLQKTLQDSTDKTNTSKPEESTHNQKKGGGMSI